MLRLTVSPEEYLMIGDNIKIVFLGGVLKIICRSWWMHHGM